MLPRFLGYPVKLAHLVFIREALFQLVDWFIPVQILSKQLQLNHVVTHTLFLPCCTYQMSWFTVIHLGYTVSIISVSRMFHGRGWFVYFIDASGKRPIIKPTQVGNYSELKEIYNLYWVKLFCATLVPFLLAGHSQKDSTLKHQLSPTHW